MLKGSENLYEHTTATRTTRGSKCPKVQEARRVKKTRFFDVLLLGRSKGPKVQRSKKLAALKKRDFF
jgi:hypothetical protein